MRGFGPSTYSMEIDMTDIIKPIPDHRFHNDPDDLLQSLIRHWRDMMDGGENDRALKTLINDAYKVLGYRCALEYIDKYSNEVS